jgi:hypothetical protein
MRPLRGLSGRSGAGIHAVGVNSGNRISSIAALAFLGAFAAADAGRVRESSTGAMWAAPELVEALNAAHFPDCTHEVAIEADLQTNGRVVFAWHPATGELSFAANEINAPLKRPEFFSPEPLALATQNCGSR